MQEGVLKPRRADRLVRLPSYLFVEIDRRKRQAIDAGRDVIDFGVGDPDLPTPAFIVDRMAEAIRHPSNHRYASSVGMPALREKIADFFQQRYQVRLNPESQVVVLLGAKEGIGHLPTAILNPGETVLVPEPGYPVYISGTIFAGGVYHAMPLRETNGWLPVLEEIPRDVLSRAKLMWLNYPNNPTSAVATLSFFKKVVALARKHGFLIAQDAAYSEIHFDQPPPSILQVEGAREVAVEFHSLSKTFNMTGWRIAFAVGNSDALAALAKVKSNLDSGVFGAVQQAAVAALDGIDRPEIKRQIATYRRRRDLLVGGLRKADWSVAIPAATIYVWAKGPKGIGSMAVASRLLDKADVVVIPGVGFGAAKPDCGTGAGYVRFALTVSEEKTCDAVDRIAALSW